MLVSTARTVAEFKAEIVQMIADLADRAYAEANAPRKRTKRDIQYDIAQGNAYKRLRLDLERMQVRE